MANSKEDDQFRNHYHHLNFLKRTQHSTTHM